MSSKELLIRGNLSGVAILFVCVCEEAVDMFDEKVREDREGKKEVEKKRWLSVATTNRWTTEMS